MASDTSSPVSSRRGSAESLHRVTPMPAAILGPRTKSCALIPKDLGCSALTASYKFASPAAVVLLQ